MTPVPYIVAYLGIAVFIVAVIVRVIKWLRMPMHVRWELYPVAHEGKKASYGGSFMEETDWWTKPRSKSLIGELKVMMLEIFFLVALRENNRKLWMRSFAFHFGLYLVICATVLMLVSSVISLLPQTVLLTKLAMLLAYPVRICGVAGLCLGLLGALGLLHRRLTAPELRLFNAPADIFNLVCFVVVLGTALAHWIVLDRDFTLVQGVITNLVSLNLKAVGSGSLLTSLSVMLLALLLAYIPLTHMSHFIGKYFAYHAIRWNDEPNLQGGDQESAIHKHLTYPVSWAAPHIKGDGKKTWADIATEEMEQ